MDVVQDPQGVVQAPQDDPTQDVGLDDQPEEAETSEDVEDSTPKPKKRSPPLNTLCVGCRHYVLKTDLPNHECRLPPFLRIDFKPTPAVSFITLLPF